MTKIRAVLFDMDGVLVQAGEWHYEALNRALKDFGYPVIGREDHLARFDGLPTRKKLKMLGVIPESQFEAINEAKQRHTLATIDERCEPSPQHTELLVRLKGEGYRLTLCSNSVRDSIRLILSKMAITPYFEFYLSYEDVKAPKPDPAIYLEAMKRLRVKPEEALVIEDNPNGIASARASGAHVMEVRVAKDVTYAAVHHYLQILEGSA